MSADQMLSILYSKAFAVKTECEYLNGQEGETNDRRRQVALEKSKLLSELIDIRTDQIRRGIE